MCVFPLLLQPYDSLLWAEPCCMSLHCICSLCHGTQYRQGHVYVVRIAFSPSVSVYATGTATWHVGAHVTKRERLSV